MMTGQKTTKMNEYVREKNAFIRLLEIVDASKLVFMFNFIFLST